MRRAAAQARQEEGSAMFEFGLAWLFILAPMLIGIIYGGITFYDNVVLANAVAVGARALATGQGDPTVCTDANTALTAAAYGLNSAQLVISSPPTFTTVTGDPGTSSCNATSGTSPTGATCSPETPCQNLAKGEFVTVTATYPCVLYFPTLGINLCPVSGVGTSNPSPTCSQSAYCLSSTATARIE